MGKSSNDKIYNDYVILDLETTGLSFEFDEIIEVGILKIKNDIIIDKFCTLVKPNEEVDDFITELTGITNKMLKNAPKLKDVDKKIIDFIGDDVIIGHNIGFDLGFLRENNIVFQQNHSCTRYLSLKVLKDKILNTKLKTLKKYFKINNNSHRALDDCFTTFEIYKKLKELIKNENIDISKKKKINSNERLKNIQKTTDEFIDEDNYFYNKNFCITGTLKETRATIIQKLLNIGAFYQDKVNKNLDCLIVGETDFTRVIDGMSAKQKNALKLIEKGHEIEIINENTFYKLLG